MDPQVVSLYDYKTTVERNKNSRVATNLYVTAAQRDFWKEADAKPGGTAEMLDPIELTPNKAGLVEAFLKGQELMLNAEFLKGK